jgi:hypothetical protein
MARTNFDEMMMMMQASKWDLNFGGQKSGGQSTKNW